MSLREIADRIWVDHGEEWELNLTVVGGRDGLVVIDTPAGHAAAAALIDRITALAAGSVVAVVNTHAHADHVLGNHALRQRYGAIPIHAHEQTATATADTLRLAAADEALAAHARWPEMQETPVVPADHTFSSAAVIDLGDRQIELVHPGRGHTAGDLVARIADADVVVAGDLVEQSGPPCFGPDSHPLEWAATMDLVIGLLTPATVVVPGHGTLVDRPFVLDQRDDLAAVAATITDLAGRGVSAADALDHDGWPFPTSALRTAVERGYAQLPPGARQLPLA